MNANCYKCKYYDEIFDGTDEYPFCQVPSKEEKPEYCEEKENEE